MEILLDDAPLPATPSAAQAVLLDGEGARLVVRIGADEELVEAAVWLSPALGSGEPAFASAPIFTTDKGDALTDIQWVSVDWGSARTLESITPTFDSADGLGVRVRIARGASQWYTPPGPTGAAVPNSGAAIASPLSFPDAVADRVMLEFVATGAGDALTNTFESVNLTGNPALDFGRDAKDFALALEGKRPFFNHAGQPNASVEVPTLLEILRAQLELEALSELEFALTLGAGVAGFVGLQWAFVRDRITPRFVDGQTIQTLALDFGDSAQVSLFERATPDDPLAQLRSLELEFSFDPVRERLVLDPDPAQLREGLGELVQPRLDAGQRLSLPLTTSDPLVGVALWARALSPSLSGAVELIAEVDGAPTGAVLASASILLEDPQAARAPPQWLRFDFDAPVVLDAPAWLVVHLESGELNWLLGGPRDPALVGPPHYRRNDTGTGGAWFSREARSPESWALTRVRALDRGVIPPPTIELVLIAADDSQTVIPLSPDASGQIRWHPEDPAALAPAAAIVVRASSLAAGTVTLATPRMTWREVEPDVGVGNGALPVPDIALIDDLADALALPAS